MSRVSHFFFASLLLAACNNAGKESTNENGKSSDPSQVTTRPVADTSISGCYTWISKRDTANLQIEVKGANVTGPLLYKLFEKDRNDGSFQGDINGDILSGWYLFRSEGVMSVRQLAWKIKGGELWPASGEIRVSGDSTLFAKPDQLQYDSTAAFIKVKCIV